MNGKCRESREPSHTDHDVVVYFLDEQIVLGDC